MDNREKVIKGLEAHGAGKSLWILCHNCPYSNDGETPKQIDKCTYKLMRDALELLKEQQEEIENLKQTAQSMMEGVCLLKEQEAVEPRVSTAEQRCGHCNKVIEMDGWQSCPWCGKRIDWKGWWKKNGTRNQDS